MATFDQLLEPFAKSIHAKGTALNKLELTKVQRARLLEAVSDDIKKCSNFLPHKVSRAALEAAKPLGVDLRTKTWHEQHQFDPKRSTFHVEHMVPVSKIRELCLAAESEADVLAVLRQQLCVVWVLKAEDRELTRQGFRDVRPEPVAAYRACNIEVVEDE